MWVTVPVTATRLCRLALYALWMLTYVPFAARLAAMHAAYTGH
jgi:hypothetical protein